MVVVRVLQVAVWLALAAFLTGLVMHGPEDFDPLVDGWLSVGTQVFPALLCWAALPRAGPRRREVLVTAFAVSLFCTGNALYTLSVVRDVDPPFPAPSDFAFMAFYPVLATAIALAVRREMRHLGSSVWMDSALGGLGAAAVLAVFLDQLLTRVVDDPLAAGVAAVYPACDVLLASAVIGVLAITRRGERGHWLVLLAGLACFTTVDVEVALALAEDTYAVGSPADALWPAALALVSHWTLVPGPAEHRHDQQPALLVPWLATAGGLGVLVIASRLDVSVLAVVLAALTVVAGAGRTQLAFIQLRRLADLRRQAGTDELTGLPNRRAFYAGAEERLSDPGRRQALLLLDLDRFKEVNDSLGHTVGDQLLSRIGMRLREALRDGDLLARLGGDEFAILLDDATEETVQAVVGALRTVVAEPCTLEGIVLRTDVSVGICLVPDQGHDLSVLLRRADIAMYEAKRAREGWRIYSGSEDAAGAGRLRALQGLHTALAERQLTLHYQPKVDLRTNQVHEVEALVRWNHPTRGLLYPDAFLSLAEDAGLMHALTQDVLDMALDQAAVWHRDGRPIRVAVNLSASSLVDTELPEQVATMLRERSLPADALQLEITEESLMADRDRTRTILTRLRDNGIQIAVDDFGTGYSSLAYLRELPIDELKLDRSFVFPMTGDTRAAALVFSTIDLAHSLGLRMVAEGVEDEESMTALARHGCDQAQGYCISRPLPAGDLDRWLADWQSRPTPALADSGS